MAPSDDELLRRAGGHDAHAIAELYDRYAPVLMGVALRIVRDRAEAEDVVHDVCGVVGDRAGVYVAERGSVSAWLVTLARNLSIDRKRRRDRHGAIEQHVLAHEPEAASTARHDPESEVATA
ncbi:MAG: hypothetical protein FWD17_19675, partial [Polyangiaceae bacterium]|nr:hypothetical protein [Polyangiaceae bacterium]